MAQKGRRHEGSRVTPRGTRPRNFRGKSHASPVHRDVNRPVLASAPELPPGEPDFMTEVRDALAKPYPIELFGLTNSMLASVDPRRKNPFERAAERDKGPDPDELTRGRLIEILSDVDQRETSALLSIMAAMSDDDTERVRIRRVLADRNHRLPAWVTELEGTEVHRVVYVGHVLGDGENIMLGARLGSGHEMTATVYIDHNMGTLVKDGFVLPVPPAEVLAEMMQIAADDPDTVSSDLDPADARARIAQAIETGAMTLPPFETDTWPACRPFVEWLTRLLPEGGTGFVHPEWDDDARAELTERFFASAFADGLQDADHRDLFATFLWFGCDYPPGDPLRWSSVSVEIFLTSWLARKVIAPADYLAKAPRLLRAFVRFAHHERGIRPSLTDETLAAIDKWEPEFLNQISADDDDHDDGHWLSGLMDNLPNYAKLMLESLSPLVGGEDALLQLIAEPLPDEPFSWDGIAEDIHARVADVLALTDRCCEELFDVEVRTACRRLLASAARGDPKVFRRKGRADTAAGALCWLVARANDRLSLYYGDLTAKDLAAWFGLAGGGFSQRAATLRRAAGIAPDRDQRVVLDSADYLVSTKRRGMVETRDRWLAELDGAWP